MANHKLLSESKAHTVQVIEIEDSTSCVPRMEAVLYARIVRPQITSTGTEKPLTSIVLLTKLLLEWKAYIRMRKKIVGGNFAAVKHLSMLPATAN